MLNKNRKMPCELVILSPRNELQLNFTFSYINMRMQYLPLIEQANMIFECHTNSALVCTDTQDESHTLYKIKK